MNIDKRSIHLHSPIHAALHLSVVKCLLILLCIGVFGCNAPMPPTTSDVPSSHELIALWPSMGQPDAGVECGPPPNRLIKDIKNPSIRVFLPEHPDPNRPAVIICPGGGYWLLAIDKEGNDVARMFNRHGVAAIVLQYRLPDGNAIPPGTLPLPVADVQRAIRLVRADAAKWNIDPARIGVLGFSAGGHLASTAATQFDAGHPTDADAVEQQSSRPDFAILLYPVITLHEPVAHEGSRKKLLGPGATTEMVDRYSADVSITNQSPPLFLVHAEDDKGVVVQNSLRLAEAASRVGVSCTVVLLQSGGHGFGLGVNGGEPAVWPGQCISWMHARGLLSAGK
jgi:acetyl esterase/lipase